MPDWNNELRETDPEIQNIPPAPERTKLIRQREHLTLILVKLGFRQLVSDNASGSIECVLLLKDCAQGNEKIGVRIFIPYEDDYLQMALLGKDDENDAIVRLINEGGYFRAEKGNQERGMIGEYYNVTMTNEPPATSTKIKTMSLRAGTSSRILALLKRVILG